MNEFMFFIEVFSVEAYINIQMVFEENEDLQVTLYSLFSNPYLSHSWEDRIIEA